MLAVALKGVFLIGVISWYSVAIMSMINDYFRAEFREYLKKNPIASTKADQASPASTIVIAPPAQAQQPIENGKLFESIDNTHNEKQQKFETNELFAGSIAGSERNGQNGQMHCDPVNNKKEILMRLFGIGHHSCDVCAIDSGANG